jgi:hypothetical protein
MVNYELINCLSYIDISVITCTYECWCLCGGGKRLLAEHGRRWVCTATRDNERVDEEREELGAEMECVITVVPR